jgi:hypothetical protein
MPHSKRRALLVSAVTLAFMPVTVNAITLFESGLTALTAADLSQLGRLNRNGIISDWSVEKVFPGTVTPTTAYHYHAYVIPDQYYAYLQITFDDVALTSQTFASAYFDSYNPNGTPPNNGLNINYLGDAGTSGNYFGSANAPRSFQVILPGPGSLVVVVNDTSAAAAGLNQPFEVIVDGYTDTNFDDQIPEPATLALSAAGLAIGVALKLIPQRRG